MQSIINEVARIRMPAFNGDQVYMHAVNMRNPQMPKGFGRWQGFLETLLTLIPYTKEDVFVTIDEKDLKAGQAHRRAGAHIDGIWNPATTAHRTGYGIPTSKPRNAGGGVLLVANFPACKGYRGEYEAEFGKGGDLEHIRHELDTMESFVLKADHVYQCNVFAIHESLPVEQDVARSLVRITLPESVIIR